MSEKTLLWFSGFFIGWSVGFWMGHYFNLEQWRRRP